MGKKVLRLPVKREYFEAIKSGDKKEEYRSFGKYWRVRITGKEFSHVEITLGYPSSSDTERIIKRPWRGYRITSIIHKEFGDKPATVFAIKVNE